MLHPARLWKVLGKLFLCRGQRLELLVKDDRPGEVVPWSIAKNIFYPFASLYCLEQKIFLQINEGQTQVFHNYWVLFQSTHE